MKQGHFLELSSWGRRQHFEFFRRFEHPFFNLCAPVEVTGLRTRCAADPGASFFLGALHAAARAAHEIEPFRYRLRQEGPQGGAGTPAGEGAASVFVHEHMDVGTTLLLDGERFVFAYLPYRHDLTAFQASAREVMEQLRAGAVALEPQDDRDDLIHFSSVPWVSFSSVSHARRFGTLDSTPKIVFGKFYTERGPDGAERVMMPLSVEVHHAMMDGVHVGRFFERFTALCA